MRQIKPNFFPTPNCNLLVCIASFILVFQLAWSAKDETFEQFWNDFCSGRLFLVFGLKNIVQLCLTKTNSFFKKNVTLSYRSDLKLSIMFSTTNITRSSADI